MCIGENKGADQLRSNCVADHLLCFRYMDGTIPLLSKSKISSLYPSSVTVQPGLCWTWSEPELLVFSRTCSILFQRELLALSLELNTIISKDTHFERLVVSEPIAAKMFEDNRFKSDQIPDIAAASEEGDKVTIYRTGDHIDITRGPLISTTGQIGRFNVAAVSILNNHIVVYEP